MSLDMSVLLEFYKNKIKYINNQHEIIYTIKQMNKRSYGTKRSFVAEGIWLHEKLLAKPKGTGVFIFCPECIYTDQGLSLLKSWLDRCDESYIVSKKVFNSLSDRDEVDGFLSIGTLPSPSLHQLQLSSDAVILILDGLESPGNIGTILRTSDGAGVDAVFLCHSQVRLTHPKLIKSSMGAVLEIPIFEFNSVSACMQWLEENQFALYLADTQAKDSFKTPAYGERTSLVMGNERYGISEEWYLNEPRLISIPMLGQCDSLNVGVATSIIIYEICFKRKLFMEGEFL